MTETRDNYQLTVASMLAWNRKVSDMIHGRYNLFCSRNAINLLGDVAMLDLVMQSCSCFPPSNHLHEKQDWYCYSAKLDTRVIFSQSIVPPTKLFVHDLFK